MAIGADVDCTKTIENSLDVEGDDGDDNLPADRHFLIPPFHPKRFLH